MTRRPGQHRDLVVGVVPRGPLPQAGPIAIEPRTHPDYVAAVEAAGGVVAPLSDETRGLIWLTVDEPGLRAALAAHPGIDWVQLPMAGVEAFAPLFEAQGDAPLPLWTSAKGAFAEPVAEHAVMLALALLRGIPERSVSTSWAERSTGTSLYGRRVLLVGAGGIAGEIVRLLAPFEVEVTAVRRSPEPMPGVHRTITTEGLSEALPQADVVILAAAATAGTRHLIGAAQLAAMKPGAVLVNIARGALVDQDALADALESGRLAGAGLDVTTPEPLPDGHRLWHLDRCVITSHSADTPEMVRPLLAQRIRANVAAFHGDGAFVGRVEPRHGY